MLSDSHPPFTVPLLLVVDGESKTAKTTATNAIRVALQDEGLFIYEADAGAFFRRMTIGVLERLNVQDFSVKADVPFTTDKMYPLLESVIEEDFAFLERDWTMLESPMVEQHVSVIGNTTAAQKAMDCWYEKVIAFADKPGIDALVVNARNPRARLAHWKAPILEIVVDCEPAEAARRVLCAHGNTDPTAKQLATQEAAVIKRRHLDRHRETYPFVDAAASIDCDVVLDPAEAATVAVAASWESAPDDYNPMAIRYDTSVITKERTISGLAELARAAVAYARHQS